MKKKNIKKAVALKYEPLKDNAPKITAKGNGLIAEKILELAMENGIPIKEDPDLVGALAQLDFHEEIPPQFYRAIAEILAFTYRLNSKLSSKK